MLPTIIGISLLLSPLLLIITHDNKKLGFVRIILFILALQLFIAITTQLFHIFSYPVILGINVAIFLGVLIRIKTNFRLSSFELKNIKKIDFILVFVILTTSIYLYSVHYNYNGKFTIATTSQYQEIENLNYKYPYYADEWYAVALIQDSIDTQSLPISNPLVKFESKFINLELFFHSFLAEIILLLDLNPLIHYTILGIVLNTLIVLLIYVFLRSNDINNLPASLISLSTLYLTNGVNLPGLWYLLPLTLGLITMLIGFIFISFNDKNWALISLALTILFYPPLILFLFVALLLFITTSKELIRKEKLKEVAKLLTITISVIFILTTTAFVLSYFNKIQANTYQTNTYNILVIGDLASIDIFDNQIAWTHQIEQMLNMESSTKEYRVYNEIYVGYNTAFILSGIRQKIDKYNPDMVITIMGMSDELYNNVSFNYKESKIANIEYYISELKLNELRKWLLSKAENIENQIIGNNIETASNQIENYDPFRGWLYIEDGEYEKAEKVFKEDIEFNSNSENGFGGLAVLYGLGLWELSESKIIEINKYLKSYGYSMESTSGVWQNRNMSKQYLNLHKILQKKSIVHVAMQYPLRSVDELRAILKGHQDVIFLSNEKIFNDVLKNSQYDNFFVKKVIDDFRFDHINLKASKLIAENVANLILNESSNN